MRRTLLACAFSMTTLAALAPPAPSQVIVRGPFGGGVFVGPPGVVVVPAPPPPPPIVVMPATPPPPIVVPAPQPAAVLPQDFIRTFQPKAGHYQVVFIHTRSQQPVTVAFDLPAGNPRMSYFAHSLVFDYGRHEVEIRFQIGGRVKVSER
jgi:hypothetical protein